jgi:hypothetical protein
MLSRQPRIFCTRLTAFPGNHPVETDRGGNAEQKIVIQWNNDRAWRLGISVKLPKLLPPGEQCVIPVSGFRDCDSFG